MVDAEGPAILMWAIESAMEGCQSLEAEGSFYGNTVDKAKAAARSHKEKMSPHRAWMEDEDVGLEPGARVNAHTTWKSYKEWVHDDNPTHRETKQEFRDNLTAATNGVVTYGRFGDERVFFGMRFKNDYQADELPVNVLKFPEAEDAKK